MEPKFLEGAVTLRATCAQHEHNQNPLLNSLRSHFPIRKGDYDFTMKAAPRSEKSWVEFMGEFDENLLKFFHYERSRLSGLEKPDVKDRNSLVGRRPVDVFWKITNYGYMCWKPVGKGAPSVEEKMKPDIRPHEVSHLHSRVLRQINDPWKNSEESIESKMKRRGFKMLWTRS